MKASTLLITGGSGFIGSALIRHILDNTSHRVINFDKLTYAVNPLSLDNYQSHPNYTFIHGDICDGDQLEATFDKHQPDYVVHLAAESHVDKSIYASSAFIQTNIIGTYQLLQCTLGYWHTLETDKQSAFRLLHISTDEVFGDLEPNDAPFTERSRYKPSSPYSASKASSDHLVRAWHRTYGLPILISNCSNNYGPYQHAEKLIPKLIHNAYLQLPLPIYGDGQQIRDWLHVDDHAQAMLLLLEKGKVGETYCVGGECERANLEIVNRICETMDGLFPNHAPHIDLIQHVKDREGHDVRYSVNTNKIKNLGWYPSKSLEYELPYLIRHFILQTEH
ncbi:dTDP-glucose 4,6-dehydratase [Vibrio hippocampi]|nr:dTDP-glucose 4,6-dehydratase [Vibrio hippocampi]